MPTQRHQLLRGMPRWCTHTASRQPATSSEALVSVPKNSRSRCRVDQCQRCDRPDSCRHQQGDQDGRELAVTRPGPSRGQHHHCEQAEVELLLERQGPEHTQGSEQPERLARIREGDRLPVGEAEQPGGDVAAGQGPPEIREQRREHRSGKDDGDRCRQEPSEPAGPESRAVDDARALAFGQQQARDQVARQREERRGGEEGTRGIGPGRVPSCRYREMEERDGQHEQAPQPVEGGHVPELRRPPGRGGLDHRDDASCGPPALRAHRRRRSSPAHMPSAFRMPGPHARPSGGRFVG